MQLLKRNNSEDTDFHALVAKLDADLHIRDGEDHAFFAQFNKIDKIRNVVVFYEDEQAIACGAFKEYADKTVEIKRMFVEPDFRGRGIAARILAELEKWAAELQYKVAILETGFNQPEAIRLYQKSGYQRIPNYGQYEKVEMSICMQKGLSLSAEAKDNLG